MMNDKDIHGQKEQKCLDYVRERFKAHKDIELFGITIEDYEELENILKNAKALPHSSNFPDFLFDNGYIEHFQITASKVTRKGAKQQNEYAQYRKKTDAEVEAFEKEVTNNPHYAGEYQKISTFKYPEHNYHYLSRSLHSCWEHHIQSLNAYSGEKDVGVFMIDFPEHDIEMYEEVYKGLEPKTRFDGLREPQRFHDYRLSRDKIMLDYLYGFKEQIKYVIYICTEKIEIIRLDRIPEMKKLLPWPFAIVGMLGTTQFESVYSVFVSECKRKIEKNNE